MLARHNRIGLAACVVCGLWVHGAGAEGMELIAATDTQIAIHLDAGATGPVRLLEIEPYDTLNPLRDLVEDRADCQALDLSNEGFLRMTFVDPSPSAFDPQIRFPENPVNADYVGQFSMRARVSGTAGGAAMPIRIWANIPAFVDVVLPADGAWHIVRADMTTTNWSGMRTLRIDPADAQGYAVNANAVLDIDWVAMTYRDDFSGDRNHTGLDVFLDLGVPEASWSGTAQPQIVLPRHDGLRDRLYTKYVLTSGGTNQIGSARFVTDLSGLSYAEDATQGWLPVNPANGMLNPTVSGGVLSAPYATPTGTWDPGIASPTAERANMGVAQEFAMKYRITGYTGGQPALPLGVFGYILGERGYAFQDDTVIPDGAWHVKRITLDSSAGSLSWHGQAQIRLDIPNEETETYPVAHFTNAVLELDWVTVSDDPLFTPSLALVDGGRVWTFTADRTIPLTPPASFKGMDGDDLGDKVDLGAHLNKMNFLQLSATDLSSSPAAVWPVDEFNVGINENHVHNILGDKIRFATANGMATVITGLNSLQDYWLDEGAYNQRFNPLRNYLTSSNAPNSFSVAHNVMDPVGLAYFRGVHEYLGRYFSDPSGVNGELYRFTIGNEVDAHWWWYNVGEVDIDEVVDLYLTACRIADLALRSQHPDYRIYLSFTHYWNAMAGSNSQRAGKVKAFLETFAAKAKAEGDFPWALCIHPYPVNLFDPTFWDDSQPTDDFNTQYVTFKNLQVIRRWLQQESMLYNGQVRGINLGEQGFHVITDGDPGDEAVQAAALAYSFKIVEQVPDIEAYLYHRQADHPDEGGLRFGLWAGNPAEPDAYQLYRKRPSWYVMQDYGTTNESARFDPYLSDLPIASWDEINLADIELRYGFDAPDADITGVNLPDFAIANGVAGAGMAVNDPQVVNLNVNTYGDGQETLLLRLKTEMAGGWQLFWQVAGDPGFTAGRSVTFPVPASGEFGVYAVDLSTNAGWVGQNIVAWRLDPVADPGGPGYGFEIDYMLFGPVGDFDGDGISDAEETLADTDGDGLPDMADTDSNGNGWPDAREVLLGLDPASTDTDGDGMDNDWEIQYGFNPHDDLDAGWDLDLDGYNTLAENIALTDPTDGLDYFIIDGLTDGTNVYVEGKAERTYTLWVSDNLLSNQWDAVDSVYAPADMPVWLVDTNIAESGMYRVDVSK